MAFRLSTKNKRTLLQSGGISGTTFGDVTGSAIEEQLNAFNSNSTASLKIDGLEEEMRKLSELTGEEFDISPSQIVRPLSPQQGNFEQLRQERKRVLSLLAENELRGLDAITQDVRSKQLKSVRDAENVAGRASGFSSIAGSLVGVAAASLADPNVLLTTLLAAPLSAGTTVARAAATEFLSNAIGEGIIQAQIVDDLREIGLSDEEILREQLFSIGGAALLGGALGGAGRGIGKGVENLVARTNKGFIRSIAAGDEKALQRLAAMEARKENMSAQERVELENLINVREIAENNSFNDTDINAQIDHARRADQQAEAHDRGTFAPEVAETNGRSFSAKAGGISKAVSDELRTLRKEIDELDGITKQKATSINKRLSLTKGEKLELERRILERQLFAENRRVLRSGLETRGDAKQTSARRNDDDLANQFEEKNFDGETAGDVQRRIDAARRAEVAARAREENLSDAEADELIERLNLTDKSFDELSTVQKSALKTQGITKTNFEKVKRLAGVENKEAGELFENVDIQPRTERGQLRDAVREIDAIQKLANDNRESDSTIRKQFFEDVIDARLAGRELVDDVSVVEEEVLSLRPQIAEDEKEAINETYNNLKKLMKKKNDVYKPKVGEVTLGEEILGAGVTLNRSIAKRRKAVAEATEEVKEAKRNNKPIKKRNKEEILAELRKNETERANKAGASKATTATREEMQTRAEEMNSGNYDDELNRQFRDAVDELNEDIKFETLNEDGSISAKSAKEIADEIENDRQAFEKIFKCGFNS